MKTLLLVMCIIGTPQLASAEEGDVGRYRLHQGQYQWIRSDGKQLWEKALIKIDTKTGEMFVCRGGQTAEPIPDKPGMERVRQYQHCFPFEEDEEFDRKIVRFYDQETP